LSRDVVMSAIADTESDPIFETRAAIDRRRPGRIEDVSPHLLHVLREEKYASSAPPDLQPFSVIAIGALLSIPLWYVLVGGMMAYLG
jgi:hypothetical protein